MWKSLFDRSERKLEVEKYYVRYPAEWIHLWQQCFFPRLLEDVYKRQVYELVEELAKYLPEEIKKQFKED